MMKILIDFLVQVFQDEKVAKGTIAFGATTAAGTILEWIPLTIGILTFISTTLFTLFLWRIHKRKEAREEEFHQARMEKMRHRRSYDAPLEDKD